MRPYRSTLYMPGSNARALDKARTLPADALIFDLEDAVAPDAKDTARTLVAEAVAEGGYGERRILVRINGLDTAWGPDDLNAAIAARPHAILIPKVSRPRDVKSVRKSMQAADANHPSKIWAMIETPAGVMNAGKIARCPGVEGFVLGTNDLINDLGARQTPDRLALVPALVQTLMAARAAGLICVDGVFNAFRDDEGLRAECQQGRALGFDGKTLIHPAQISIANEEFAPSENEIALAERQVLAFEEAEAQGAGVAVLDGRIVENLHVKTAKALLAKAEVIGRLSG